MIENRSELSPPALLVYTATGVVMLGTAAMSPVLPALQSTFDVSDAGIGLVMSVFTFAVAVTVPFQGWLADRFGRRPVLGGSLILFGIAGVGTYLAPDFRTVLALRALQGVGFAGSLPLVVTIISDMFDGPAEIGAQGYRVTAVNLAGFLFPVATGLLVVVAWNVPFLLYGLAVPVGIAVLYWLPEYTDGIGRPEGNYVRAVLLAARSPLVALAVSIGTLRFFTLYALYAYLPLLIITRDLGAGQVGIVIGTISAVKMIVATQAPRSLAIGPPRITVVLALFASLLIVGSFSMATSFLGFLLVAGALGAAEGVSAPLQKTVLTRYAAPNVRAGVVSFNAAAQNFAKTLGPIVLGLAVVAESAPAAFVGLGIGGAVLALGLLGVVLVVGDRDPPAAT